MIERFYKTQLYRIRRLLSRRRIPYRPGGRGWAIGLPLNAVESIQAGALRYSYRGMPMLKHRREGYQSALMPHGQRTYECTAAECPQPGQHPLGVLKPSAVLRPVPKDGPFLY